MGFPGSGLRLQPVTVASRIASRSFSDSTSTRRIVLSNVLEAHSSFFFCVLQLVLDVLLKSSRVQ